MSAISPLDDDPATDTSTSDESVQRPDPSSPRRLRSLRALALDRIEGDDTEAAAELTEKFRSEYAAFAEGKDPAEVDLALNSPPEQ